MIVITGGAGFIGYHLAKHLADSGRKIRLLDNLQRGRVDDELTDLIQLGNVEFVQCDLTQQKEVESGFEGDIEQVYHLAAVNGTETFYKDPALVLRTNTLSLLNVLEVLKDRPLIKILFSSSSEVYASSYQLDLCGVPTDEDVPVSISEIRNPRWSYAASKIVGESACFGYEKSNSLRVSVVSLSQCLWAKDGIRTCNTANYPTCCL